MGEASGSASGMPAPGTCPVCPGAALSCCSWALRLLLSPASLGLGGLAALSGGAKSCTSEDTTSSACLACIAKQCTFNMQRTSQASWHSVPPQRQSKPCKILKFMLVHLYICWQSRIGRPNFVQIYLTRCT